MDLPLDFRELLEEFAREGVEYLIVGGYAVAFHARPRATKDLDSFMGPSITCDHTAWPGESACGNQVLLYKVEEGGTQKAITPSFIDTSPYIAVLGG